MYFKATVAAVSATCLMSSCCTNTLTSASCARQMGITVEPCVGESLQGAVANGVIHASTGLFEVFLKVQQFLLIQSVMLLSLLMPIKSVLVMISCACILLLCLGGTSAVCFFSVLKVTLMNLCSLFLVDMLPE